MYLRYHKYKWYLEVPQIQVLCSMPTRPQKEQQEYLCKLCMHLMQHLEEEYIFTVCISFHT